jgi:outer membrane protein W
MFFIRKIALLILFSSFIYAETDSKLHPSLTTNYLGMSFGQIEFGENEDNLNITDNFHYGIYGQFTIGDNFLFITKWNKSNFNGDYAELFETEINTKAISLGGLYHITPYEDIDPFFGLIYSFGNYNYSYILNNQNNQNYNYSMKYLSIQKIFGLGSGIDYRMSEAYILNTSFWYYSNSYKTTEDTINSTDLDIDLTLKYLFLHFLKDDFSSLNISIRQSMREFDNSENEDELTQSIKIGFSYLLFNNFLINMDFSSEFETGDQKYSTSIYFIF